MGLGLTMGVGLGITDNISRPPTSVPITIGNTLAAVGGISASANNQVGAAFQAAQSGTLNFMTIVGEPGAGWTADYRLCIYNATSATVWSGSKLGETAILPSLGISEVKKAALLAPVNVIAGNWYALTVHSGGSLNTGHSGATIGDRFFSDTFADGALATAGASGLNSGNSRCIYATTL